MTWPAIKVEAYLGGTTFTEIPSVSELTINGPSREKLIDRYQPGSSTFIADNTDGALSPFAVSGAFTSGGASLILANLLIRYVATYAAVDYALGVHFLDVVDETWHDPGHAEIVVSATDVFKLMAQRKLPATVLPAQTTGARLDDLLTAGGWATVGVTGLGNLAARTVTVGASLLDELALTWDHEHGRFHGATDTGLPDLSFRPRDWSDTSTSWTFSDAGGGALEYEDLKAMANDQLIVNYAEHGNSGGATYTATNATSVTKYGQISNTRSDWGYESDTEVEAWPALLVDVYGDQSKWFSEMTFRPDVDDALWPAALTATNGQKVSITRTPPNGVAITRTCFIEGIRHEITPASGSGQGMWRVTWRLADAVAWAGYVSDVWDTAVWDTSKWYF